MKVMISILGKQEANGEENSVELVTEGEYEYGEALSTLRYEESALTGMEGTVTTFAIEPGVVTMSREGSFTSQMLFRKDRKHLFLYSTPYGSQSLGIHTRRLHLDLGAETGRMEIHYDLDVDNHPLSRNEFLIEFKGV